MPVTRLPRRRLGVYFRRTTYRRTIYLLAQVRTAPAAQILQDNALAGSGRLIQRLDDMNINQPFDPRGLGILVSQNTFRKMDQLRAKLVAEGILTALGSRADCQ